LKKFFLLKHLKDNLKIKIMNNTSHADTVSSGMEEAKNYKVCSENISDSCIGTGDCKDFRKSVCILCYNHKYMIKNREKRGNYFLTRNDLSTNQIALLYRSLTSQQLMKLSGMLTSEQQELIIKNKPRNNNGNTSEFKYENCNSSNISTNLQSDKKLTLKILS